MGKRSSAFTVLAATGIVLVACQSPAALGALCARASDCASPLVCTFGHCRTQCAAGRDCAAGQVCLIDEAGRGACELPAIDVCSASCDPPLVCASGHCRVECTTASDCPSGHTCAASACQRIDDTVDAGPPIDAPSGSDANLVCDPALNTGCTGAMRCGFIASHPGCVPSGGTATLGQACGNESDCAIGFSCQGGRCVRVCHLGDSTVCGADLYCSVDSVSGQTSLTTDDGLGFCTERCDLFTDTGCAMGTCAFGTGSNGNDFTWCRDVGSVAEGAACQNEFDCARGLGCHTHVCRTFCHGTGDCGAGNCELISTFQTQSQIGECSGP